MNKENIEEIAKIGYEKCIETIGIDIFERYKENSCFAHDVEIYDVSKGLGCFVGLTTDQDLSDSLCLDRENDGENKGWDYYVTCHVKNGIPEIDTCRKPVKI